MSLLFTFDPSRPRAQRGTEPRSTEHPLVTSARTLAETDPYRAAQLAATIERILAEKGTPAEDDDETVNQYGHRLGRMAQYAVSSFRLALCKDVKSADRQRHIAHALSDAMRGWSVPDVQNLAGWLTTYAARLTGHKKHTDTDDARTARAAALMNAVEQLDDTSQQHFVALAVALADPTPKRTERLKKATRDFLRETLAADDFHHIAKLCIDWMRFGFGKEGGE